MALDLAFPHGDFGERTDPTFDEIIDPESGLCDGAEQSVAGLGIQ